MSASPATSPSFFSRLLGTLLTSLLFKMITFSLSTLLTRSIIPETRGVGFLLDLYADSVGFLSREAVRTVAMRLPLQQRNVEEDNEENETNRAVKNGSSKNNTKNQSKEEILLAFQARQMAQFSCTTTLLVSLCVFLVEGVSLWTGRSWLFPSLWISAAASSSISSPLQQQQQETSSVLPPPYYQPFWIVGCVWLGLLCQNAAEPIVVLTQCLMCHKVKIVAESLALFSRLLFLLAMAKVAPSELAREPFLFFAMAQLLYGVVYGSVFLVSWWWPKPLRLPALHEVRIATRGSLELSWGHWVAASAFRSARHVTDRSLWRRYFQESVLRLVLTEGEKVCLSLFGSLAAQGSYDTVMNLGSLVARLVFRVWEEASFAQWTRLMSDGRPLPERWRTVTALLEEMLSVALHVAMPFVVFGPPWAASMLQLLYGGQWAKRETVQTLQLLCLALPLMAVNGLLEAFLRATASAAILQQMQRWMIICSIAYLLSCYGSLTWLALDVTGLMLANLINMALRIGVVMLCLPSVGWGAVWTSVLASRKGLLSLWVVSIAGTYWMALSGWLDQQTLAVRLGLAVGLSGGVYVPLAVWADGPERPVGRTVRRLVQRVVHKRRKLD